MRITPTDPGTPMLIRTDFTDGQAWQRVADAALAPSSHGFRAQLELVDDPCDEGLTVEQAVAALPAGQGPFLTFLADPITITDPEHPIVVVDLGWEPGRHFRVAPAAMWSVENNLSLSNMDWEDFAASVDADGVFRGFGAGRVGPAPHPQ